MDTMIHSHATHAHTVKSYLAMRQLDSRPHFLDGR